jgi:hypothetical protein
MMTREMMSEEALHHPIPQDDLKKEEAKEEPQTGETAVGASGWSQVVALMEKNALTKIRTPAATMAEIMSPVILMLILWISYNLSVINNVPARFYHAFNVDLPLFWNIGEEEEDWAQADWDPSDTHRRHLATLDQSVGQELSESTGEKPSLGQWARMLSEQNGHEGSPEEEFGFVNDLLMARHLVEFNIIEDGDFVDETIYDDDSLMDLDLEPEDDDNEDGIDSGDWYEEIMADLKKETVDRIDWNVVVDEMEDNFGEIWDRSKNYLLVYNRKSTRYRLNQLRIMVSFFVSYGHSRHAHWIQYHCQAIESGTQPNPGLNRIHDSEEHDSGEKIPTRLLSADFFCSFPFLLVLAEKDSRRAHCRPDFWSVCLGK